jgi:hypothetical protein
VDGRDKPGHDEKRTISTWLERALGRVSREA